MSELKIDGDYILWITNRKMTCGVIVEEFQGMKMLRETPPILRKFRGSDEEVLKKWLLRVWPETKFEIRESPTQRDGYED